MRRTLETVLRIALLIVLTATDLPASAGQRAGNLYPAGGIIRVRISPDGEWVVATAVNGET